MTPSQLTEDLILYRLASGKWDIKDAKKRLYRSDFEAAAHLELFDSIMEVNKRGEAITPNSVIQELRGRESLGAFGTEESIRDMIVVAESIDLEEDLRSLKNKSLLRKIKEYAADQDPREAIEKIKLAVEKNAPPSPTTIDLKFISGISPEYFKTKPPEKPRLLYFVDKGGRKISFLHKGIVGMLVAEGGRGKTHLLSLLGASVATGIPWMKEFVIEKPGAVCLIVGENDSDDIHRLLWKTREHLVKILTDNASKKDHERFMLHFQEPLEQLSTNLSPISIHGREASFIDAKGKKTDFYQSLLTELKAKEPPDGWQLIILDPASRFAGPEAEKDNAIATAFIASLENISSELRGRPTIILAHHKSKAAQREGTGQSDARGSSGLTDGVRWQANLNRNGDDKESSWLEISKTNFTSTPNKIKLKKDREGVPVFDGWDDQKNQTPNEPKGKPSKPEAEDSYDIGRFK